MKVEYPKIYSPWEFLKGALLSSFLIIFTLLVAGVSTSRAEPLYVIKGSRGVITFTTRTPSAGENYKVFVPTGPSFSHFFSIKHAWVGKPVVSKYDELIRTTAEDHEMDPALVKAVVHVESMFDPQATSPKGAMGLMQLMPATASRFGIDKPYHPSDNLRGGVKYLQFLTKRYAGNMRLILAAYNAGEGAVDRMKGVPPFTETQVYVRRVIQMRELYRCAILGRKNC